MGKKLKKKKKIKKNKDLLVNRLVKYHFSFFKMKYIMNYFDYIDLDETESDTEWELL